MAEREMLKINMKQLPCIPLPAGENCTKANIRFSIHNMDCHNFFFSQLCDVESAVDGKASIFLGDFFNDELIEYINDETNTKQCVYIGTYIHAKGGKEKEKEKGTCIYTNNIRVPAKRLRDYINPSFLLK
jgi:hypothetical protein